MALYECNCEIGSSSGIPLLTESQWNSLSTAQKQGYGLVAIQKSNTGFLRGNLVNGANYVASYLPYSDSTKVVCEATVDMFNSSSQTWGTGTNPVQYSGGTPVPNSNEGSIIFSTSSTGTIGYVDLGSAGIAFTAYVVMKASNPSQYSRLICAMNGRASGKGIMLFNDSSNKVNVSSWASDSSTGISSLDYFIAAIQYDGSGHAFGYVRGDNNFINKTPNTAGRYLTLGRTDITAGGSDAEPCDVEVKYIGVVKQAESQVTVQNNITNLYNNFISV